MSLSKTSPTPSLFVSFNDCQAFPAGCYIKREITVLFRRSATFISVISIQSDVRGSLRHGHRINQTRSHTGGLYWNRCFLHAYRIAILLSSYWMDAFLSPPGRCHSIYIDRGSSNTSYENHLLSPQGFYKFQIHRFLLERLYSQALCCVCIWPFSCSIVALCQLLFILRLQHQKARFNGLDFEALLESFGYLEILLFQSLCTKPEAITALSHPLPLVVWLQSSASCLAQEAATLFSPNAVSSQTFEGGTPRATPTERKKLILFSLPFFSAW